LVRRLVPVLMIVTIVLMLVISTNTVHAISNNVEVVKVSKDFYIIGRENLKYLTEYTPILGEQKILVIFVEFTDVKHSISVDAIRDKLLDTERYYSEVSYGQLTLLWHSYSWQDENAWLTLPHTMAYYGAPGNGEPDARWQELVLDSIKAADPYVDYRLYKRVIIFHAGGDEAMTGNPNDIWSIAVYGKIETADGIVELNIAVVSEKDPIGVIAHELGHTFWLPDLYAPEGRPKFVGHWCLMAYGSWNGPSSDPGSSPAELCSWCRLKLGWIQNYGVISINAGEIENFTLSALESPVGYKVAKIQLDDKHYYLIEVRIRKSFDTYLPGEGVLILYVDETKGSGKGIVKVVDSTPGDDNVDNGVWTTGMTYHNSTILLTVNIGSRVGEAYSLSVRYKVTTKITLSSTTIDVGGLLSIHIEHDDFIDHVEVWLEDEKITSVYPDESTYTLDVRIPMPKVKPGAYKLKVKVYDSEGATTETFNVNVIEYVKPSVSIAGPLIVKPGEKASYIAYIAVKGSPYDPEVIRAYLTSVEGVVVGLGHVRKLGKGVYLVTIEAPKVEGEEYYTLKMYIANSKGYVFEYITGHSLLVGVSLGDVEAKVESLSSKLGSIEESTKSIIGSLKSIKGDIATIQVGIGLINASLKDLKVKILGVEKGIVFLNSSIGIIKADLSSLKAKIVKIEGGFAILNTSIGMLKSELSQLSRKINATIVKVEEDKVLIKTSLGEIKTSLKDINAKLTSIEDDIVIISSDLGELKGKVERVIGDLLVVKTDLGELKVSIPDYMKSLMKISTKQTEEIQNISERLLQKMKEEVESVKENMKKPRLVDYTILGVLLVTLMLSATAAIRKGK